MKCLVLIDIGHGMDNHANAHRCNMHMSETKGRIPVQASDKSSDQVHETSTLVSRACTVGSNRMILTLLQYWRLVKSISSTSKLTRSPHRVDRCHPAVTCSQKRKCCTRGNLH